MHLHLHHPREVIGHYPFMLNNSGKAKQVLMKLSQKWNQLANF